MLHAGLGEVLQDGLAVVAGLLCGGVSAALRGVVFVDQFSIFVDRLRAVGREGFHGERPGDADAFAVLVGLVVEELVIGLGGDGGVDFALPSDARLPEPGEGLERRIGPFRRVGIASVFRRYRVGGVGRLARDLPFHETARRGPLAGGQFDLAGGGEVDLCPLAPAGRDRVRHGVPGEGGVEIGERRLDGRLHRLPDRVDLGVVGDALERDVGHAVIDEAVADVVIGGVGGGGGARHLGLFPAAPPRNP